MILHSMTGYATMKVARLNPSFIHTPDETEKDAEIFELPLSKRMSHIHLALRAFLLAALKDIFHTLIE